MNTSASTANNLVLGLVKEYEFEQIKPFLASLRDSGYQGDVCLLVSELSPATQQVLQKYAAQNRIIIHSFRDFPLLSFPYKIRKRRLAFKDLYLHQLIQLYPLNNLYVRLVNAVASLREENPYLVKCHISKLFLNAWCVRYPLYYLYLSKYGKYYESIMLTDTRDVLFQANPFSFDFDGLCCFLENEEKTIKSCEFNSNWILKGFGENALHDMGHQTISCSGTTIGTRSAIMLYLETMVDHLIQLKTQFRGIDQGVHNYILRKGLVEAVRFYDNHHGPVLTMHHTGEDKIRFNSDGYVINEDGSIINVLHQYDRQSSEIKNKMLVYRKSGCIV